MAKKPATTPAPATTDAKPAEGQGAAAGTAPAGIKNFRQNPDIEGFYQFVWENDLRVEAKAILDEVITQKRNRRAVRTAKSQAH